MIQIAAEPLYNTPLVHWTLCLLPHYGALARKPSQGTKLYCLVNRGTLGKPVEQQINIMMCDTVTEMILNENY